MLRWVVVALLGSLGCVSSPRAASELAQKTDPVTFSGVFEAPEATLALQAKNQRTGAWVQFGTVRTRAADPLISGSGATFYRYAANVVLPQAPDYWIPHPKSGRIEAQVRVVSGDRVLRTFETDAESCAQRGHARGLSEAALFEACAAREPQLSRVFVAACGGFGEPCCPQQPSAAGCDAAFSCQSSLCVAPPYPVPMLRDHRVDLSVPDGHRLRDAWLVLDDQAGGRDSERPLMRDHRLEPGVTLSLPHPNVARLSFDVGYFKAGKNRFKVRGIAGRGEARRALDTSFWEFDYALPRTLGLGEPGHFELPNEHFPRRMSACRGPFCKDADRDGLNDLWENVAVHQLRPRLRMDGAGGVVASSSDLVRVLTSVTPLQRGGQEYVLFASVVGFGGPRGARGQPSDAEAFGMLYRIDPTGALRWVASAANGQSCLTCRASYAFFPQDFDQDGTPLLYVERKSSAVGPVAGLTAGLRGGGRTVPEVALGKMVLFFESNTF